MKKKNLLIVGAGGHGQVVREIALSIKVNDFSVYDKIDFIDDVSDIAIGNLSDIAGFVGKYDSLFCSIGNSTIRKQVLTAAKKAGYEIPSLIHQTAYISPSAKIGAGVIIEPNAVVNSNSIISDGCIISSGAVVDHDVTVGEYSQINAGVVCNVGMKIEPFTKVSVDDKSYSILNF